MEYEMYQDKKGKWRWRALANNGNIVADGAQGYTRKASCKRAIKSFQRQAMYAPIKEA